MYYNNKKLLLSIFWVCAGISLIILSGSGVIDGTIWSGTGGALCTVEVAQIVRNIKYQKDSSYREKVDIELSDERNRFVRMKAWSWAGCLFVMTSGVVSLVLLIMGYKAYGAILSGAMCFVLVAYWMSYIICKRKC